MSRMVTSCCVPGRRRTCLVGTLALVLVILLMVSYLGSSPFQDVRFYNFILRPAPTSPQRPALSPRAGGGPAKNPTPPPARSPFKRVRDLDVFLYSAILNDREPVPGEANIILTGFDSTGTDSLQCCVVTEGDKLFTMPASVFYKFYVEEVLGPVLELFKRAPSKAKQYACILPQLGVKISHVTLTSSTCPDTEEDYLPVIYPETKPKGLALCAKTAFGNQLDPVKLMEWFEVQRLLGVDHIQLMDLDNPEPIQKVFRYYTQMGLLQVLPYQLPGPPIGRGLDYRHSVPGQTNHDESFSILDCKQRLRGYTFILGHDMDEVLMPAKHQNLKDLFKEQLMRRPGAAGFYFYTQFFVEEWGPQNKDTDVFYFRYLNSTWPRNECKKYVYLSSRVEQARTHAFTPRSPYQGYFVAMEDAILHHYRKCPHGWSTCNPPRMTDRSMLRFKGRMEERLKEARKATGIYPVV